MSFRAILFYTIITLFFIASCAKGQSSKTSKNEEAKKETAVKDTITEKEEGPYVLTEDNAIPFFFEYEKENKENRVEVTTAFGSFVIELYERTPYHRANFIYLTKKGYFNDTFFHRIVKDFIIQGGNADNRYTSNKRRDIGRYLLPPDTRKGYRHHRGTISMPSSESEDNPHKLASPYEFFIVVTKPGSYHLDGSYTPFGRVVKGMDVVDKICNQPAGEDEWPLINIPMQVRIVE